MDLSYFFHIIIGFVGLVALAIPFSDNFKEISFKYIFYGILAQLFLALILLKVPFCYNCI
jgi:CNT family concentrative nucleoside transporter